MGRPDFPWAVSAARSRTSWRWPARVRRCAWSRRRAEPLVGSAPGQGWRRAQHLWLGRGGDQRDLQRLRRPSARLPGNARQDTRRIAARQHWTRTRAAARRHDIPPAGGPRNRPMSSPATRPSCRSSSGASVPSPRAERYRPRGLRRPGSCAARRQRRQPPMSISRNVFVGRALSQAAPLRPPARRWTGSPALLPESLREHRRRPRPGGGAPASGRRAGAPPARPALGGRPPLRPPSEGGGLAPAESSFSPLLRGPWSCPIGFPPV